MGIAMAEIFLFRRHLALTLSLFARYGAVLTAICAAGMFLHQILLRIAVELGMTNRLAGLVGLSPVILLNLLVLVGSLMILRQGMPRLRLRRRLQAPPAEASPQTEPPQEASAPSAVSFATALLAVLIPFYGYYAGWGLLGDTLRSYGQVFHETQWRRIDFTQGQPVAAAYEIGNAGWVVVAVVVIWAIRFFAKRIQKRSSSSIWPLIIVCCEATWALLGLYVLSGWKDQFAAWLASLPPLGEWLRSIVPAAAAQTISDASLRPVDWPEPFQLWPFLQQLFWYAMLPLVWFNLAAIVYGHDLNRQEGTRVHAATAIAQQRWQALPKPVTDFVGYFWAGVVKRWYAVTNGVLLASSAGVALTASVLVLWRLVDWLGNWAWIGTAYLIGPQDMVTWQVVSVPLNAMFNAPGAPAGGLLVMPLQFCVLAAGLELVGQSRATNSVAEEPEAPAAG